MRWMIAGLIAVAGIAQAADDIAIAPDAIYQHKPSGLSVPLTLDSLPRARVGAYAPDQLDEFVDFRTADDGEDISIFVYRLVIGDMPVWFDRTRWTIENRKELYGDLTPLDRPVAFVPPGQSTASGLMRIYLTGKGPARSTAVAMIPLGDEWIVNIRYSSNTHSAEALEPRLRKVIAELGWPKTVTAQPATAEVAECGKALTFKGTAKMVRPAGAELLMQGMGATLAKDAKKDKAVKPVIWCRDSTALTPSKTTGLYRADGADDRYIIAFSDAGRGLSVVPDALGQLISKGPPRWLVSLADMHQVTNYPPYDRMPTPAQAVASFEAGRYTSIASTWGKDTININSAFFK